MRGGLEYFFHTTTWFSQQPHSSELEIKPSMGCSPHPAPAPFMGVCFPICGQSSDFTFLGCTGTSQSRRSMTSRPCSHRLLMRDSLAGESAQGPEDGMS